MTDLTVTQIDIHTAETKATLQFFFRSMIDVPPPPPHFASESYCHCKKSEVTFLPAVKNKNKNKAITMMREKSPRSDVEM